MGGCITQAADNGVSKKRAITLAGYGSSKKRYEVILPLT
jgi:hypothetical protein